MAKKRKEFRIMIVRTKRGGEKEFRMVREYKVESLWLPKGWRIVKDEEEEKEGRRYLKGKN